MWAAFRSTGSNSIPSFPTVTRYRREQCDHELLDPDPDGADQRARKAERFIGQAETLL